MDAMFSKEHYRLRKRLQNFSDEDSNFRAPHASSVDSPSPITMTMRFKCVPSIEEFQIELALRQQEQKIRQQREELEMRLSSLDEQGISPEHHYDNHEYIARFQYMLDTITLLGELGEIKQAAGLRLYTNLCKWSEPEQLTR